MLCLRHFAGRAPLRALLIGSAALLVGAALIGGTSVRAEPTDETHAAQSAPFVSDRLSVEVVGQGPDVILIPGFASSREVWRAEATRLSATHRVHLVQLAGFAGQPWSHGDGPFLQPMLNELARYIARAGLQRPAVIGHSMGGLTGMMLAQQHPDRVGRVMSVDSLPFFSALFGPTVTAQQAQPFADQAAAGMLNTSPEDFRASSAQTAAGYSRTPATQAAIIEWSAAGDRHAMASAIREVMTTDMRPLLPGMTTPVWAVYASDADGGVPAAMADAMWAREYAGLPGVHLERVDDSRHFIMADQPQRMARIIDRFLAQ